MKRFDLRHSLVSAGLCATSAFGLDRLLTPIAAGAGVALTFHRVRPSDGRCFTPNAALEITPVTLSGIVAAVVAAGLEPICIDDVPERFDGQRRFAVFTFDDGYRDNLEFAAPLLRRMGVPWTLFVVPGFLDRTARAWWIELEFCLNELASVPIFDRDQPSKASSTKCFAVPDLAGKAEAFAMLRKALCRATKMDRVTYLETICKIAGIDPAAIVCGAFADAGELDELLASSDVTLGSHTSSHPVLSYCNRQEAEAEIKNSRLSLGERFGREVRHLAFPHGDAGSCGRREQDLAKDAGYATAWTTRPAHIGRLDKKRLHALPRVSMNGLHASPAMARTIISGAPFLPAAMLQRLRGACGVTG